MIVFAYFVAFRFSSLYPGIPLSFSRVFSSSSFFSAQTSDQDVFFIALSAVQRQCRLQFRELLRRICTSVDVAPSSSARLSSSADPPTVAGDSSTTDSSSPLPLWQTAARSDVPSSVVTVRLQADSAQEDALLRVIVSAVGPHELPPRPAPLRRLIYSDVTVVSGDLRMPAHKVWGRSPERKKEEEEEERKRGKIEERASTKEGKRKRKKERWRKIRTCAAHTHIYIYARARTFSQHHGHRTLRHCGGHRRLCHPWGNR